jgi:PAS domain S-box-containing protein
VALVGTREVRITVDAGIKLVRRLPKQASTLRFVRPITQVERSGVLDTRRDLMLGGRLVAPLEDSGAGEARSVAQLKMLHSLATRLNGLSDVQRIGEAVTAELRSLINYHNCRVFVFAEDGETLLPIAFRGELLEYQGETFEALVTKIGTGVTGHVALTGESYYSPNANDDPHAVNIPGTPEVDESLLAVPLTHGKTIIGVVILSKLGIDQFDQEDQRVLEVLASHAAVAIQNARSLQRERDAAERARESEARKSAILEAALDSIIVMDHRGTITEFNPAAVQTFGYSRNEAIGRDMADLIIPEEYREAHREGLARYLRTGQASVLGKRLEMKAMRADGSEFPVELAITKVDLPGPPLFTGYIRDITELKRGEAEIERVLQAEREASQRLRALDEMKNTFLQAVSHDLRTPLTAILGLALTLERRDLDLSPLDRGDLTRRLAANARKLERILSNLLDLERLIRGVVEPTLKPTDVGSLIRWIVEEADFLGERQVHVQADTVVAEVDAAKIERIVENLLVNAAKHTPDGTPIWVRVWPEEGGVLFAVEDAGPGVPEHARKRIFEPFQQGPQEHPSPGCGIGLSLVARFAELHGGRAWVESRPGGGASFRVFIPSHGPAS